MEHIITRRRGFRKLLAFLLLYGKHFGASSGSGFCHVCRTDGKLLAGRPVCGL